MPSTRARPPRGDWSAAAKQPVVKRLRLGRLVFVAVLRILALPGRERPPRGDWESAGNWLGLKLSSSSGYMSTAQILHFHQEKSLLETGTVAWIQVRLRQSVRQMSTAERRLLLKRFASEVRRKGVRQILEKGFAGGRQIIRTELRRRGNW